MPIEINEQTAESNGFPIMTSTIFKTCENQHIKERITAAADSEDTE
jgi:hypothetical protein